MSERNRQANAAAASDSPYVYRWHFVLAPEFGGTFSAIAISREAALVVMDAECRGASLTARYDGATTVFGNRERMRETARVTIAEQARREEGSRFLKGLLTESNGRGTPVVRNVWARTSGK